MSKKIFKLILVLILPTVIILGFIIPWMGFVIFGCMIMSLLLSLYKGRFWCGNICPRGIFLDIAISKISFNKKIPKVFKSNILKVIMIIILMTIMGLNIYLSHGDMKEIGEKLVYILFATTLLAILLGVINPRTWCSICPMGYLSGIIGRRIRPLHIFPHQCIDCNICAKKCKMNIKPNKYKKYYTISDTDCIKCGVCKEVCPKRAIA